MMDGTAFRGLGPALVTPMHADGRVDLDAFEAHVDRCVAAGVDFVVPCGTTGEAATLTADEQREVIGRCVAVVSGRVPVLAGAGSNSTGTAAALSRGAADAGADGVLIVTPYYNKPTPDGLIRHYRAVAEASGLPIVLYNVPGRTGANVGPEVVRRVAKEVPAVVGVKEAAGSLGQVMALVDERRDGFIVLSGDDDLALAAALMGADGCISVVGNQAPAMMTEIIRLGLTGGAEEARRLHYRLLPLMKANFAESNPGPLKATMEILGHFPGHLRSPLAQVTPETRTRLKAILKTVGELA